MGENLAQRRFDLPPEFSAFRHHCPGVPFLIVVTSRDSAMVSAGVWPRDPLSHMPTTLTALFASEALPQTDDTCFGTVESFDRHIDRLWRGQQGQI